MKIASWSRTSEHLVNSIGMSDQLKWNNHINALLPPQQLLEKYSHLESEYYTIDYAELEDGSWKIIEAGDGQVSGLAEHQDYEQYFKVLYEYLNE